MSKYLYFSLLLLFPSGVWAAGKNNCSFPEVKKFTVTESKTPKTIFQYDEGKIYDWSFNKQDQILKCMSGLLINPQKSYPYIERRYWKYYLNLQIPGDPQYNNDYLLINYHEGRQDLFERAAAYFDQNGTMVAAVQSHYLEKVPDPAHPSITVDPRAATIVTIRKGYDTPALRHYIWVDTMPSVVVTGANARQLPIVEIPQP